MRVARSLTLEQVRVERSPDPVAGAGEVVCRVLACGVCGSDVTDWYVERKLPAVLGHEPVGVVTQLGAGVERVSLGDVVAIHHHVPCGECRRCLRGHETVCERFRASGLPLGGFAEQVLIPAELVAELLVLPPGLEPAEATLVEPLACVLRSQDRAGLGAGDTLLVVGAGAMGLLQVAAARARGVAAVWVREPRPDRLALAERWGAERHGNEPVEVAIVCTAAPAAIEAAALALAPGGTLCLYAPPAPSERLPIEGSGVFLRELTVCASYSAGPADMRAALDLLAAGAVPASELVTHRLGLDEVGRALELQRSGGTLKAVVVP